MPCESTKSIGDWLLFRKLAAVRRRLFGDDLSNELSSETKRKRLTEPSRAALEQAIGNAIKSQFSTLPAKYGQGLLADYVGKFRTNVLVGLQKRRSELEAERAGHRTPFEVNAKLLESLREMREQTTLIARELESLADVEDVTLTPLDFDLTKRSVLAEMESWQFDLKQDVAKA